MNAPTLRLPKHSNLDSDQQRLFIRWLSPNGRPVIALTQTAATILAPSGANLTYGRNNKPAPPLGDRVDDISGARA